MKKESSLKIKIFIVCFLVISLIPFVPVKGNCYSIGENFNGTTLISIDITFKNILMVGNYCGLENMCNRLMWGKLSCYKTTTILFNFFIGIIISLFITFIIYKIISHYKY